jgi:lycopene cyclase domain-containing protein
MDKYLYISLNLGSLLIPLAYSILEKKFHFIQYIKIILISILIILTPFIIWDAIFTQFGFWGFNERYHLPFKILSLPIEEWLFFICIPYACLFTHEAIIFYTDSWGLKIKTAKILALLLIFVAFNLLILNLGKAYTTVNLLFFLVLMTMSYFKFKDSLASYLPSFIIILFPFLLINGILTGSFIAEPVVWYNNQQNMGIRIGTIPLEDVFYAFNLLFSIQLIFNYLKLKKSNNL